MRIRFQIVSIGFLFFISLGYSQSWKTYPYQPEGSLLIFPEDEGRHEGEPIEWWYTSGYLTGETTGTLFSYMISYFYYPSFGYDGFRIFNLSNEDNGQFFSDFQPVDYTEMGIDRLHIMASISPEITESWSNKTDGNGDVIPFEYVLSVAAANAELDLEYVSLKPPLILGDSGLFNQGFSSYTYYYSLTKNAVEGTLIANGITELVSGFSWIDRQYGTFNPLIQEDYEWFSLQLSNEMDINLWNLFTPNRQVPETPAYRIMSVYVDENTQFTTEKFEIERLSFIFMPDSTRCYSQKWRLTSSENGLDLIITTRHNNSEVQLPFRFFEGATTITGTVDGNPVTGMGFAELLHSYSKPDISITYPDDFYWNSIRPIIWHLANPDYGRPLKYNLECSTDNKQTFFPVAEGITDTLFYWTNPSVSDGDSCWFKVTAYSIDSTLQNTVLSTSPSLFKPNLTAIQSSGEGFYGDRIRKIYPNPANETLMIELIEGHSYSLLQIMNINGQIILEKNISSKNQIEININSMVSGVYFIGLYNQENITIRKFLVR